MSSAITNINALRAQNAFAVNQQKLSISIERLSSGVRINSAIDDAAGLSMASRMTAEISVLSAAGRNVRDGTSALQTADGGLAQITNALQHIRVLAVQAATDTLSSSSRTALNNESFQMVSVIDRMVSTIQFNNMKLLDGSFQSINIQIGAGNTASDQMSVSIVNSDSYGLGLSSLSIQGTGATVGSTALASGALTINGTAIGAGASASAKDVSAAINLLTATTGVTATARATVSTAATPVSSGVASVINLGSGNGQLIAPVQVDGGKWYYYWDRDGSGSANDADMYTSSGNYTFSQLFAVFKEDVNGVVGASTNNTYRYATLNGVRLALPTIGGSDSLPYGPNGIGSLQPNTSVVLNEVNNAYDDLLAIWDAYATYSFVPERNYSAYNGKPPGWHFDSYISATPGNYMSAVRIYDGLTFQGNWAATAAIQVLNPPIEFAAIASGDININNVNIGAIGSASTAVARGAQMAVAINAQTSATGVSAAANASTGGVTLTAADGRNIEISTLISAAITSDKTGIALSGSVSGDRSVTTVRADITLSTSSSAGITIATSGNGASASGLSSSTVVTSDATSLDLTTTAGAFSAMTTIDTAIRTISNTRASLGANENTLDYIGSGIADLSMNMTQALSRVVDTDYASETENLTKMQILAQATAAMLTQATASQRDAILALIDRQQFHYVI
ncbi:MAG: flagellin [Limnohabitans sp.]|jgi:flagellin